MIRAVIHTPENRVKGTEEDTLADAQSRVMSQRKQPCAGEGTRGI